MSGPTIGVVANIYNEANALPGWLECATSWADWVGIMHSGPQGTMSNDGTLEILERWRIPVQYRAIDDGFGAVRTATLRMCPIGIDYVMLLDADERFYPVNRIMSCSGEATPQAEVDAVLRSYDFRDVKGAPPDWNTIGKLGARLKVELSHTIEGGFTYDQIHLLRELLRIHRPDAVATIRRHWHDITWTRPTQNWHSEPDYQMRVLRNDSSISFNPQTRMHEGIVGVSKVQRADLPYGPFFDHFHFTFKRMEQLQRAHDIRVYDAINEGRVPPTWEEFSKS